MAEEQIIYRLQKVAKEFNVSVKTIVDYLRKKGRTIDMSPNSKIGQSDYDLIAAQYKTDSKVKEQADKIKISVENQPAQDKKTEKKTEKHQKDKDVKKESKSNDVKIKDKPAQTQSVSDVQKEEKEEVIPTNKPPKQQIQKKETPKLEQQTDNTVNNNEQKVNKPKKSNTKTANNNVNAPVILDKIDLSTIDYSLKPKKKKSKIQKEQELAAIKEQEHKVSEEVLRRQVQQAHIKEEKTQKIEEPPQETTAKVFMKTEYVKLSGPVVVGEKIDLASLEKPKSPFIDKGEKKFKKNKQKEKRQRLKQKTEQVQINAKQQGGDKPQNNKNHNNKHTANKPFDKNNKKDFKQQGKFKKKKEVKKEIDTNEIERLVKENLARLSASGGKSKTSKHKREKRKEIQQHLQEEMIAEMENRKILKVTEFVTANELAAMMEVEVTKVIAACMTLGMFVSINQRLDAEAIQLIADEFGFTIEFVSADVVEALSDEEKDDPDDLMPRAPIVTVMGHVDHGKTSLLDYIRHAHVIASEAGGITQHIGAYEVTLPKSGKKITFLDTPGHSAFTAMRARGAKMTDIAIIVVACDDKIMPQTIEAINHAQAAGVPIVFALNKIDKPGADPDRIKTELANMNFLVEEWGGKYQSQEISAKLGTNVEELLEKVLLEAEILELKANPNKRAKGAIIESSLDKGRGYVAKILVQDGTIHHGDIVLAGATYGKVKAMYNERNQIIKEAGPSTPVLLLGLNGAPQAGDAFNVMENEKETKDLATRRLQLQREQGLRTQKHITLDEIGRRIAIGDFKQLDLIVKADVDGSVEALSDSLLKLSTPEVQVNVIHKSVGQITESDVLLATASNAIIIGFQVRPSLAARKIADAEQIDIRLYSVIYSAINELKDAIEGMLSPDIQEKIIANLEVREVFKISKVGTIAGCMCLDGKINRNTKIRIIRDGIVVHTGKLASLKRFKDEVKEVVSGQDCGLNIENFNDIKVGDIIEGYEEIEIKRTLK